jgi:hypothetical protein
MDVPYATVIKQWTSPMPRPLEDRLEIPETDGDENLREKRANQGGILDSTLHFSKMEIG